MVDYEKAYKESFAKAKEIHRNEVEKRFDMEWLFPELKESEDERIRKALIGYVESIKSPYWEGILIKDILAWLEKQGGKESDPRYENLEELLAADNIYQMSMNDEMVNEAKEKAVNALSGMCIGRLLGLEKQGEQKPFDYEHATITQKDFAPKIEPKFKVGKWYQCAKDFFGKGVTFDKNTAYYCAKEGCLQNEYGCHIAIVKDLYDNFKLWTIQDAKDGDILVGNCCGTIICEVYNEYEIQSYCRFDGYRFIPHEEKGWEANAFRPATKEQRDQLEKAMLDAGYKWNPDEKKLEKIEQKQEWSEEDKKMYRMCMDAVEYYHTPEDESAIREWLKSLINRVQPLPKKWSEEDESYINNAIASCRSLYGEYSETAHWLKSLKDRMKGKEKQQ